MEKSNYGKKQISLKAGFYLKANEYHMISMHVLKFQY